MDEEVADAAVAPHDLVAVIDGSAVDLEEQRVEAVGIFRAVSGVALRESGKSADFVPPAAVLYELFAGWLLYVPGVDVEIVQTLDGFLRRALVELLCEYVFEPVVVERQAFCGFYRLQGNFLFHRKERLVLRKGQRLFQHLRLSYRGVYALVVEDAEAILDSGVVEICAGQVVIIYPELQQSLGGEVFQWDFPAFDLCQQAQLLIFGVDRNGAVVGNIARSAEFALEEGRRMGQVQFQPDEVLLFLKHLMDDLNEKFRLFFWG